MNIKKLSFLLSLALVFAVYTTFTYAEGDGKNKQNTVNKPLGTPVRAYLDINQILTVIKNDGISDIDVNESNSGLVYPKGSGKTAVYTSGFLWGAYEPGDPQVRVGPEQHRFHITGLTRLKEANLAPEKPRPGFLRQCHPLVGLGQRFILIRRSRFIEQITHGIRCFAGGECRPHATEKICHPPCSR